MIGDRLPPGLLNRRPRSFGIVQEHSGGQPQRIAMAMAVQLDPVSGRDDLGDQRRPALDLLADEEKGRSGAGLAEDLEHDRRALWVRTVVEAERYPVDPVLAPQDPVSVRYARDDGGKSLNQGPSAAAALCAAAG